MNDEIWTCRLPAKTAACDRSLMDKTMASDAVVAGSSPVGRTVRHLDLMEGGRAVLLLDF